MSFEELTNLIMVTSVLVAFALIVFAGFWDSWKRRK